MTGYGRGQAASADCNIEVSIRAVNGRFLEPRFHIPREYLPFEADIKKILTETLQRGTVDIFVSHKIKTQGASSQVILNTELGKKYYKAYSELAKALKLKSPIHLESIARLNDVIRVEEDQAAGGSEKKLLEKAFRAAVNACDQERKREGKSLRAEFDHLLRGLEKQVHEISETREEANQQLQERFETKIKSRLKGAELDPSRLSQEIVIQLEKADINEELSRLAEHIKNYRHVISSTEANGKKLDFYTQELLREVNTIGSKSQVAKITTAVVEAKTIIERLREQVQNIE